MAHIFQNRLTGFFTALLIFSGNPIFAQWKNFNGTEWISRGQPYVKFLVEKRGLQRVAFSMLPTSFPTNETAKLQMWHRGKQVAISVTDKEIIFYGQPNDGASDSLVYRPESARLNPHVNLFSDKGAYFLTIASNPNRIATKSFSETGKQIIEYQIQADVTTFTNQFAFSTFDIKAALNKSYYEAVNTWTGPTLAGVSTNIGAVKDSVLIKQFSLKNFRSDLNDAPVLELLFAGLNVGNHNIQISIGPSDSDSEMRKLGTAAFTGFDAKKVSYNLRAEDVKPDGTGFIKIRSTTVSNSGDWYSLSYFSLTYPQGIDMAGLKSAEMTFPSTNENETNIRVKNAGQGWSLYDVSNPDQPVKLDAKFSEGAADVVIDRKPGKMARVLSLVDSEINDIALANISTVNLKPLYPKTTQDILNPAEYDYLIVTTKLLAPGAIKYAEYRGSAEGGSHKVVVMDIADIYDQFNYGEPSPVGLRRFVNYMLKDGVRDAHSLLLIGHSVSYPARVKKELPDEVPTMGDPGSDMLLVSGLAGYDKDVPAIPVGRINAFNVNDVAAYLDKVKMYESEEDKGWRKNILHLNGGHSVAEVNQLKGVLATLAPIVEKGEMGAQVKPYVKNNPNPSQPQKLDIRSDINGGVGMLTYFGHGSQQVTDLDFGYVSDISRGYEETRKYTTMFFNGCGVGNIFTSPTTQVLSSDWIMSPNKGAIAVVANAYDSYVSTSTDYLKHLYTKLFGEKTIYTVGEAVKEVAMAIVKEGASDYDIANFQQSNLQGDPVLRIMRVSKPDYEISNPDIILYSDGKEVTLEASQNPRLAIVRHNRGRYSEAEKPVTRLRLSKGDGSSSTIDIASVAVAYSDTVWMPISNIRNVASIGVTLDPQNLISELEKGNNTASLEIDWEIAKLQYTYSNSVINDKIAPQLFVTINNQRITNEEKVPLEPVLSITIQDDRQMEIDFSAIEVYLKSCYDDACDFERISNDMMEVARSGLDGKQLTFTYIGPDLQEGKYSLLVSGKDAAGNTTTDPYLIRFQVEQNTDVLDIVTYPNPASEYVKFVVKNGASETARQVLWQVYSSDGHKIWEGEKKVTAPDGINWYWIPNSPNGIYTYKVVVATDVGEKVFTGKISLVK